MDFIPDALTGYYGLDWLSSILGLFGLYLVSERRSFGFLCTAAAVVLAAVVALMAAQYGFLLANTFTLVLALRGYYKWRSAEPVNQPVDTPLAEKDTEAHV